jgi:hypothetical protein
LEILLKRNPKIKEKISIIFLGRLYRQKNSFGLSIIEEAKNFNNRFGDIIKYYEKLYIPEEEYRKEIEETDVLINPINLDYYKFEGPTSGLCEAISYSIPGIYPAGYKVIKELGSSSLFFDSPLSLANLIEKIVVNHDFLVNLKKEALLNSKKVSLAQYSEKIFNFIIT